MVEDPRRVLARLARRRRLRQLGTGSIADRVALAYEIGIDPALLSQADGSPLPPARLIADFAAEEPDAPATIPIDVAIVAVGRMLTEMQENARAA